MYSRDEMPVKCHTQSQLQGSYITRKKPIRRTTTIRRERDLEAMSVRQIRDSIQSSCDMLRSWLKGRPRLCECCIIGQAEVINRSNNFNKLGAQISAKPSIFICCVFAT